MEEFKSQTLNRLTNANLAILREWFAKRLAYLTDPANLWSRKDAGQLATYELGFTVTVNNIARLVLQDKIDWHKHSRPRTQEHVRRVAQLFAKEEAEKAIRETIEKTSTNKPIALPMNGGNSTGGLLPMFEEMDRERATQTRFAVLEALVASLVQRITNLEQPKPAELLPNKGG
jgi:hypothetical protein